MKRTKEELKQY